jgi:hypothetical protein
VAKKKAESPAAKAKPAAVAKATKARAKKATEISDVAAATGTPKKRSAKAPKPTSISSELIGHAAGDVWRSLAEGGVLSLPALKKATNAPEELVLAAIGWLAREDKLSFDLDSDEALISLR